ncbi:MAG: metal-dependent hydrolase [Patescibacteria group bacterium]|jgi:hypothetical protein
MIFAHAPAGYLILRFTEKFWNKKKIFKKKKRLVLYLIGIIFSIFPDFDLFYHYFYSANTPHRQYISHGIIVYLVLFLLIYLIGLLAKKQFIKSIAWVILLGVSTHLFLDTIASGIAIFTPLSSMMIGLRSIWFLKYSFFTTNLFLINCSLELLITLFAIDVFVHDFVKNAKLKLGIFIASIIIFISGFIGLAYVNAHIYNGGHFDAYFEDNDHDGIINLVDFDIDGNGILNINDADANGNGFSNKEDILSATNLMIGRWYDFTEGSWGELFSRWGLLTNSDLISKTYEAAGIYFQTEFDKDYKNNPNDYVGVPDDPLFDRRTENIYAFCKHNDRLFDGKNLEVGDIVFFNLPSSADSGGQGNGLAGLVTSFDKNKETDIIIGEPGKMIYEENLNVLNEKMNGVKAYCRIVKN